MKSHYPNQHYNKRQQAQHGHAGPIHQAKGALFVGDLSFYCNESDLKQLFSPYGKIKRAEIKRGRFGDSLMHGFVELDSITGAQRALEDLNTTKFLGRRLRIHWAYSNAEKSTPRDREGWTQVHIAFTTSRLDISVSESMLDNLFCRFGEIADITVKKLARTSEPPLQSGYAFVYFYDADAAMVAADTLARITVQDVTLECSLSFRSQRIVDTTIAVSSGIVPPQLAHELFPPESYGPQLKKDRHNHAHHVPQQHKAFVPALAARSNSPTYAHSMNNGSKLAHFSSHCNNQHVSEDNVFSWSQPQQQKSALFGSLSERSYSPTTFWPSNPVSNEPFTSLNAAPAHTHSLFYEEDDVLFENKYSPSQYPQYSRDSESLSDGLLLPPVHLHTPWQLNVDIPSTDYGSFSHDNSWISSSSTSSTSGEGSSPTQQSLFARAPLSAMQQATHA